MNSKPIIPVFFALDDNYAPYLAVAVKSLTQNASKDYFYNIHILHDGLDFSNRNLLSQNITDNARLIFDDVSTYIKKIRSRLDATLRDYYTASIFYRLFIAALYPDYKKAIYLDCDITVIGDISKLYSIDLGDKILGVVPDDVIAGLEEFRIYAQKGIGVEYDKYFNSGVMLMNLEAFREQKIKERFVYYLVKYNFESACPDQDYLNALCKDRVLYIERGWDRMSTDEDYDGEIYIVHYNNFKKPWYYDGVCYEKYFWQYAKTTNFYQTILKTKEGFTPEMKLKHEKALLGLIDQTKRVVESKQNFRTVFIKNNSQR